MTKTVTQGQSLLERYQNASPSERNPNRFPERERLGYELESLLEAELCQEAGLRNYRTSDFTKENQELLKEFRENFTWEQSEEVIVEWHLTPSYEDRHEFDTKEELVDYLRQDKNKIAAPEVSPYDLDIEFEEVYELRPSVEVIKLQPIKELEKSFQVVIKVDTANCDKEQLEKQLYRTVAEVEEVNSLTLAVYDVEDKCPSV